MTEREWLNAASPGPMLQHLARKLSDRKLRVFSCACCRRVWDVIPEDEGRRAVEVAEQYADRAATGRALKAALTAAARSTPEDEDVIYSRAAFRSQQAMLAALNAAGKRQNMVYAPYSAADAAADGDREPAEQAELLRDIVGNPFRPVTLEPAWLTPTVVQLARGIYDERAFDRLPILADALQDAGCDNDVLAHCRGPGPHVRGCWVVDLVLGKS
jgi:hypothetical protein